MKAISKIRDFLFSKFYQAFFYSEAVFFIAVMAVVAFVVIGR